MDSMSHKICASFCCGLLKDVLCFIIILIRWIWFIWPYPSGLILRHRCNHMINPIKLPLTQWSWHKIAAILAMIFSNAFSWMEILLMISLKFDPRVWIDNIPTLIQIITWCRPGDKPLSEPMIADLLMHIWVTRPQWVKNQSNITEPRQSANIEHISWDILYDQALFTNKD